VIRLLVLHALRLKGFADTDVVVFTSGLDAAVVCDALAKLQADELVRRRDGRVSGWSLTPVGRDEHRRLVGDELAASGAETAVRDCYGRFLGLNHELLSACTDWQLEGGQGPPVEAGRRQSPIERLMIVHEAVVPIADDLAAALLRFARYGPRLTNAVDRVRAGEVDWFTKPVLDSYHTVWFELHEDLLVTLGIERGEERDGEVR